MQPDPNFSTHPTPATSERATEPGDLNRVASADVPAIVQRGQETFRRELPELLGKHYRQWVAYHGEHRLGFGRWKTTLLLQWIFRGIPRREMVVRRVESTGPYHYNDDIPDVITEEEAAIERLVPSQLPTEVHPMIRLAQDTYRRELPELLKTHYHQWVVYHGDRRLGFGRSKTKLLREWIARGIPDMEIFAMWVEPTIPYDDD